MLKKLLTFLSVLFIMTGTTSTLNFTAKNIPPNQEIVTENCIQQASTRNNEVIGVLYLYLTDGNSTFVFQDFNFVNKDFFVLVRFNGENLIEGLDYEISIMKGTNKVSSLKDVGTYTIEINSVYGVGTSTININKGYWNIIATHIPKLETYYTGQTFEPQVLGNLPSDTEITYKYYINDIEVFDASDVGLYKVIATLKSDSMYGTKEVEGILHIRYNYNIINSNSRLVIASCIISFICTLLVLVVAILTTILIKKLKRQTK